MTVCTLMLATVLPIQLTYYWGDILPGWEPIWVLVDICLCADVALGFLVTSLDPKTMHYMEPPQALKGSGSRFFKRFHVHSRLERPLQKP